MTDSTAAAIATDRFGLGARPGELAVCNEDPRGWLEAQLKGPPPVIADPALQSTATMVVAGSYEREAVRRNIQQRDVKPTQDVRAVFKGALLDHLGVPAGALDSVFPGSEPVKPLRDLFRT